MTNFASAQVAAHNAAVARIAALRIARSEAFAAKNWDSVEATGAELLTAIDDFDAIFAAEEAAIHADEHAARVARDLAAAAEARSLNN